MTDAAGDTIGPDGFVRLRCYLPNAGTHWFSAGCAPCGRVRPVGVRAAIEAMGTGEATVGQLARRMRCTGCGGRTVRICVASDPRPPWVRERDGDAPETRAGFGDAGR